MFAASGHGKSFAIGTLVLEAAVAGVNSVIIDPEGEYRGLVEALRRSLPRARAREPMPPSTCSRAPATIRRRRSPRSSTS